MHVTDLTFGGPCKRTASQCKFVAVRLNGSHVRVSPLAARLRPYPSFNGAPPGGLTCFECSIAVGHCHAMMRHDAISLRKMQSCLIVKDSSWELQFLVGVCVNRIPYYFCLCFSRK